MGINITSIKKLPEIPAFFQTKIMETKKHNDSFIEWFDENVEISKDGKIPFKLFLNASGLGETDLKDGMKRMGFKYNKDLSKIGKDQDKKAYKGGYEGLRLKHIILNELGFYDKIEELNDEADEEK